MTTQLTGAEKIHLISDLAKAGRGTVTNGSTTIYAVTAGKKFYMTSILLSIRTDASAASTRVQMRGTIGGSDVVFLEFCSLATLATTAELPQSFPYPLIFDGGTNIYITSDQTDTHTAYGISFTGFEQ
jgi:hypothetical protein